MTFFYFYDRGNKSLVKEIWFARPNKEEKAWGCKGKQLCNADRFFFVEESIAL